MSFTVSQSYLKLMSIALVMLSNYLILCCSILFLPSIFLSIRTFANESALLISWPKYQSSSASVSVIPMNIVLISLRIDLFNLLAVQGTLKSLSQKHSFTASVFQCLAFFMVHLSHSYMTTGKTNSFDHINLCRQMVSLLFNILSRFVIAFRPRSKRLNFITVVTVHSDFGAQENKICHCFHIFTIYLPWSDGAGWQDLVFWTLNFQPAFSLSSFTLIKRLLSSSLLSAFKWYHLQICVCVCVCVC